MNDSSFGSVLRNKTKTVLTLDDAKLEAYFDMFADSAIEAADEGRSSIHLITRNFFHNESEELQRVIIDLLIIKFKACGIEIKASCTSEEFVGREEIAKHKSHCVCTIYDAFCLSW